LAGQKPDRLPDETTVLNFRHFPGQHGLGKALFKEVNKHFEKNGLMLREGSIVDAIIVSAPSSTKNQTGKRDPKCSGDNDAGTLGVHCQTTWHSEEAGCRQAESRENQS